MRQRPEIPLIRAAVTEPLVLAAQKIGTPVDKVLRSVGLPIHLLDDPYGLVPEIPAWKFVEVVSRMEGEPLFGLKAAIELAPQDYESVKPLLQGCANLKSLLNRFIAIVPTQTNAAFYDLVEDGEVVWLSQKGPRLVSDYTQAELFEVVGMIQLVQLVAGENWRPPEIHFSFSYDSYIDGADYFNSCRIRFSQPSPAIAIPRNLLPLAVPELGAPADAQQVSLTPGTISEQLLIATFPYIGERKLDSKLLSEITGMNVRTLQRKLAKSHTSYSSILDEARFNKAQFLLKESDEKLLNISLMLGYENASAFSRAFKRWSGVSPIEFRKINRPGFSGDIL